MPRQPRVDPEHLLRDVCRAVEACHAGRRLQWCTVDRVKARLPKVSIDQLAAAIAVAVQRGWLSAAGAPAHSLILTAAGRAQLVE